MLRIGKFDPSFEANYSIMDLTNLSDMHYIGCLPHNRIHRKTMQRSFQVKRKIKLNKQISIHQSNNMFFWARCPPAWQGRASSIHPKKCHLWTLDDCIVIINWSRLRYLYSSGGVYRSALGFFFHLTHFVTTHIFYRELYSVNFGPISNVRRYPCTTKALSFFFLYCGKIFWLPKVCM